MPIFVLFVCTGNICRSPMAVALLRAHAVQNGDGAHYRIESAGTWAGDGQPASTHAQTVMRRRGLSLQDHVARTVSPDLMEQADVVIVMTRGHRDALAAEFPRARGKLHLISELVGLEYDISDPYGQSLESYEMCAADLTDLFEHGYARIAMWLENTPRHASPNASH